MNIQYCVNCARPYNPPCPLCIECQSDPEILNEIIDDELNRRRTAGLRKVTQITPYPGEKASLILAIFILLIVAIVAGIISFGAVIFIVVVNLFSLKADHISSKNGMLHVNESSYGTLYRISRIAAYRLGIPLPEIYVTQNPDYNAYTQGFYKYGFIVMNSGMVADFTAEEIMFVLGHEMGHMGLYHTSWLRLMAPGMSMGSNFIAAPVMRVIFNVWSVKAEYSADRAGLVACRDVSPPVKSLLKLAGGGDVESNVKLSDILKDDISNKSEKDDIVDGLAEYLGTHPYISNRIKALLSYQRSNVVS